MYYVTLQPYTSKQVKPVKVDEDKVLFLLRDVILHAPHKLTVLSQERTGTDHHPVVSSSDDLIYSYRKHGFVVPFDVLQHVSRHV